MDREHSGVMRLRVALVALVLAGTLPAAPRAGAQATPTATTAVDDVRGVALGSGGTGLLTYRVTHDVLGHIDPGAVLPGARVPRSAEFEGLWGDGGYVGAWLAPAGSFRFQFSPTSTMIESAYFTNRLRSGTEAAPLEAGDRFELAMGDLSWDAPLPTDRARGEPDGTLGWDTAVDTRPVTATFGAEQGEMDAMFVRADIVARGGDVDARREARQVPPLTIDLPRTLPQPTGMYIVTAHFPYTQYVSGMDMRVFPATGKAVLTASVRGYLPEARERTLPGGAEIKEWHLPLNAVILLSSADDPVTGVATVRSPTDGVAVVGEGEGSRRVALDAGSALTLGPGLALSGAAALGEEDPGPAPAPQLDELKAASIVDHTLAEPVDLVQGGGQIGLTVDPDHRGAGILALRSVRRAPTGTAFAEGVSVPFVVVDGEAIALERSHLVDLRVFPFYNWIGVGFTGAGAQTPLVKTRTLFAWARKPGLTVDAVYDLGEDRYAFLTSVSGPDPTLAPSLVTTLTVRSLRNEPAQSRPVHHLELPAGPVTFDGETKTTEFSGPLDVVGGVPELVVGDRRVTASVSGFGRAAVLASPAPLAPDPAPDPATSIEGRPVTVVYEATPDLPPASVRSSSHRVTLLADGPPPVPAPPPIGTPCGTPHATDLGVPDAPPGLDVVDGWLDADDATIYATIRLRGAPAPGAAPQTFSFHWRYGHSGRFARAVLAPDGTWTFEHGGYNNGFFGPQPVSGEVQGELIRIAVPRAALGYLDGEALQDTGAHTWVEAQGVRARVDSAPDDADPTWGTGLEYRVGACGGSAGGAPAVVALIDTGINPYSPAFRDDSPLAFQHPSTYLEGYPETAEALPITLDLPYAEAFEADRELWESVRTNRLYWFPGTRIAGGISLGSGGTNCPVVEPPPANTLQEGCEQWPIHDDHGHGTMTSSRAAGSPHSLAPDARIVMIEGLGNSSVRWAADAGWIDVQSNSWINLVPPPANSGTPGAFRYASTRTLTLAASGNGTAYIAGGAPTPTYLLSTAPEGVVLVGGHDNGKMTLWAGAPPHVVADAYAGFAGIAHSTEEMRPDPIACCTSAASPYAAGGAVAIVQEARRILGDDRTGVRNGVVAEGPAGLVSSGPLADGVFTLAELKDVFLHTAEARPGEGRDDGWVHWTGGPRDPELLPYGVGANPFCQGCTTTPVSWRALPPGAEAYQLVGYGAINERAVALAAEVLRGDAPLPARPEADAQYDLDQQLRDLIFP